MSAPLAIVSADKEIIELARELGFELIGCLDPNPEARPLGTVALGADANWTALKAANPALRAALALDPPVAKRRALGVIALKDLATLVSAQAHVSPSATVGHGCIVQRDARVMADARIGAACKVNVGAVVHHDCEVGDCCTIAPGARLLGYVKVEDDVFIGAAATVMPKVRIGAGAMVGAGAVVTADVAPGAVVAGVPARPMKGGSP